MQVAKKGYGSALRGGIDAAEGKYIIFGDADGSYDFSDIPRFVEKLDEGFDLVMGNRFRGGIQNGAMPWLNRYLGNPVLSWLGRLFFKTPVRDFHCGLRAFTKAAYHRMQLKTTGMEFASEMVIKASLSEMRVTEIPTVLRPDGRSRPPHLRRWRDGWRHLRFMLLFCPRWLFIIPGSVGIVCGLIIMALLMWSPRTILNSTFDIHTMLISGMCVLVGYQLVLAGMFSRRFVAATQIQHPDFRAVKVRRGGTLELWLIVGLILFLIGMSLLISTAVEWARGGFGPLEPTHAMRSLIPSTVLVMIGVQTVFGSFFMGVLSLIDVQDEGGLSERS